MQATAQAQPQDSVDSPRFARYTSTAVYFAADHGGFDLKNQLVAHFDQLKSYQVKDLGPQQLEPEDDYPDYARLVTQAVREQNCQQGSQEHSQVEPDSSRSTQQELEPFQQNPRAYGVLICRSGAGMAIAANRVPQIRAVNLFDEHSARHARRDNNANVATLGSAWIDVTQAKQLLTVFLETEFKPQPRHVRRIQKLDQN
jgi:ribose 5-phosphate isomerase B